VAKEVNMPVISTNNAANAALNYLNQNSAQETNKIAQLASGSKIIQAADDAAGLAIGTQLQASTAVYQQDAVNVQQGSSILQSTDGALAQIGNVLQRMMVLATEAASGQVTNNQRTQDIATEYGQLYTEINSIIGSTKYAGQQVLGGFLNNVAFLVGTSSTDSISVTVNAITSTALALTTADVNTSTSAQTAMDTITTAINTITQERAQVGAYESEFNFSNQDIAANVQNIAAATSVIMDADVAAVKASLSANDVKTQASIAALTQAAQLPQELLKLLQS
jgi:flagellin